MHSKKNLLACDERCQEAFYLALLMLTGLMWIESEYDKSVGEQVAHQKSGGDAQDRAGQYV